MGHESPIQQRLNVTFGKFGALRYIGNLDTAKVWERVLRRADLPILYTQGFNTRPRIQLATALPLGITSECEILDVALREVIPLDGVKERIMNVSPEGLRVLGIDEVAVESPALQALVRSSEYRIAVEDVDRDDLQARVAATMAQESIWLVKERNKGKRRKSTTDLRAMIFDLYIDNDGDIIAHLATGERGNLHPRDLINQLGLQDAYYKIHRFQLYWDDYYARLREGR